MTSRLWRGHGGASDAHAEVVQPIKERLRDYIEEPDRGVEQAPETTATEAPARPERAEHDLLSVGQHVTSVLAAAEQAAENLRREADKLAAAKIAEAETYAEQRKREAEAEAERIVRDAERRANELDGAAEHRNRALLADISASEGRMTNLASSLREVADRLEHVAADGLGRADADANAPVGREEAEQERHVEPIG